jgi:DNA adenine methylase
MSQPVKPFIKWAGGKGQLLNEIRARYPANLGKYICKYAEPFVGGGAVLFDLLNNVKLKEIYISDTNRELIHVYKKIRDSVSSLIGILKEIEYAYLNAEEDDRKILFYEKRNKYNNLKLLKSETDELAALFIFLNKTCFNGLYRVNAKGLFNVPQGSYKNPCICDEENLRLVSGRLQGVNIICGDYQDSRDFIDDKTFAYFDPPYRPLSSTSNFTAYAQDKFGDKEQTELALFINEMSERGAWVVASNSDPKNSNKDDDFFDNIYSKHQVFRIKASRSINSISSKRGYISELLIVASQEEKRYAQG